MKRLFLLVFCALFSLIILGGDSNQIINRACILPPFEYSRNDILLDEVKFENKKQIITKWGVFGDDCQIVSPIKESVQKSFSNQFFIKKDSPLTKSEIEELKQRGIKISGYIPYNCYIVKADPQALALISENFALLNFSPLLKIEPALYKTNFPVNPILTVYLDEEVDYKKFFESISAIFPEIEFVSYFNSFDSVLRIFYEGKDLKSFLLFLADRDETIFIEPFFLPEPLNDNSVYVVQSYDTNNNTNYPVCATIWNQGLTGTDETPAVCDTGLDSDMCYYRYSSDSSAVADAQYPSLPNNGTIDTSKKVIVYNVLPGASAYD
ncbi:MAG: hypothetical protein N2445_07145 [Acidobacteria bacterium]|nr:hypothetical protein [Acidobacteriota bacterium]